MLGEPSPHLLIGPRPLKRMSVPLIVFRPGDRYMIDELLTALPRRPPQVTMSEGTDQQFRLVQPRRVRRREPWPPPTPAVLPVGGRGAGRVAGVAVLDQEHPLESAMPPTEEAQLLDVMPGVLLVEHGQFHPPGVDD